VSVGVCFPIEDCLCQSSFKHLSAEDRGRKMKKKVKGLGLLMLATMLFASCGAFTTTSNAVTNTASTAMSTTTAGSVVLTVTNGSTIKTYSLPDLQAFTPVTGNGGTVPMGLNSYQGVPLRDLLNAAGGVASGQSVILTGLDGYTEALTNEQITSGGFNTYDTSGNPVTPTTKPVLAVVYAENGAPLVSYRGPTEMGILSNQNLLTDPSMWIESLQQINIITSP